MRERRVTTWAELNEELFRDAWNPELLRYRSPIIFRGLDSAEWDLSTTLTRLGGEYERLEYHLLKNFRKYAYGDVVASDSVWHWLAVAQHYGLPTRLLDWTYAPFVAAHFVTADVNRFDEDGVIWCVNYVKANEYIPKPFRERLKREGSNAFTAELILDVVRTLEELRDASPEPFGLFFEPPALDHRITNQFALFSLVSRPHAALDTWLVPHLKEEPDLIWRIIVDKRLKWEIRDKLDQSNITERMLFPGLDGLSRWLRRHYSPREG